MIKIITKAEDVEYIPQIDHYPDGTVKINIPSNIYHSLNADKRASIQWNYENETEQMTLYYIVRNIKDSVPNAELDLVMPYLPNARMDRIHEKTEVFTLKFFCDFINNMGFTKVYILDAHSNVGPALLDRVVNVSPKPIIDMALKDIGFNYDTDYVFYPDEGAMKRYAEMVGCKNVGFGIKKRDWETGKILGLDIAGDSPQGKNIFIVDDICAYGGTVYYSALKLKELGANSITVFFTHCENSIAEGKLFTCGLINKIYTTNSLTTLSENQMFKIFNVSNNFMKGIVTYG